MNKEKEAKEILKQVKANNFNLLLHAGKRAIERNISKESVINCAKTCFYWEWQEDHNTYLFLGQLNSDETGGFSAIIRDDVLVVTIFKRRLTKWERELQKTKK